MVEVTLGNGERIVLVETSDGTFLCPVCGRGDLLEPPWGESGGASFAICDDCGTEFGFHDMIGDRMPIGAQAEAWAQLREEWLARVGPTPEVAAQLRNIGIDLPSAYEEEAKYVAERIAKGELGPRWAGDRTPLMRAAIINRLDLVEAAIAAGAELDTQSRYGWTALIWASAEGHGAITERLIEAGADVNRGAHYGETALLKACRKGDPRTVAALLKAGARLDAVGLARETPWLAALYAGHENVEVIRLLLEHGVDPNVIDRNQFTALRITRSPEVARLLIEHGADVNLSDDDGNTPLSTALVRGDHEIAALLRAGGVN